LYENYPGLPSGSSPNSPPGGRYPTPPSPTGNPSTPNIVPQVISSAQAPYNPARDAKTPTIDDIKRNAAFNRQLNANKAVANLISIIQQLTANVNAAKNDATLLQNQLNAADSSNNDCNNKIFDLSNTRTKIQNAIKDRQDKITEANKKIADLTPIINDLIKTRDNLVTKRT
jgi:chromosome segregation ATPase